MSDTKDIKGKYIAFRDLVINKVTEYVASHKLFVLCCGLLLAIALFVLVYPCPSDAQHEVIRLFSAFGVAGLMSLSPNLSQIKAKSDKTKRSWGISLLTFFALLIWNPARAVVKDHCSSKLQLIGTVMLAGEPLSGATVKSPQLNERDETNSNGTFNLPFEKELLDQPIQLWVSYEGVSKQENIESLAINHRVTISLADTIKSLKESMAMACIGAHLAQQQRQITNEAKRLHRDNKGREIRLNVLFQKLTAWHQLGGRVKNEISFRNGFWSLNTQRAIEETGLINLPLDFSTSWYFEKPTIYLLNWQHGNKAGEALSTLKLEYVIIENAPMGSTTLGFLRMRHKTEGLLRLSHRRPLRYAHVVLEYSNATDWIKRSRTLLRGQLPNEQYLLRYTNEQWKVISTNKPGKNS